ATQELSGLRHGSPQRTAGRWRSLDVCENRSKHRPRCLTEQPLRRSRSVYPGEEEVVHCCQACPRSGVVTSSQLMMPEHKVAVTPCDMGARALQPLYERFGLGLALVLLHRAQHAHGAPPERSPCRYASFPCMREAGDRRHEDGMPASARMTVDGHQTDETDLACV